MITDHREMYIFVSLIYLNLTSFFFLMKFFVSEAYLNIVKDWFLFNSNFCSMYSKDSCLINIFTVYQQHENELILFQIVSQSRSLFHSIWLIYFVKYHSSLIIKIKKNVIQTQLMTMTPKKRLLVFRNPNRCKKNRQLSIN